MSIGPWWACQYARPQRWNGDYRRHFIWEKSAEAFKGPFALGADSGIIEPLQATCCKGKMLWSLYSPKKLLMSDWLSPVVDFFCLCCKVCKAISTLETLCSSWPRAVYPTWAILSSAETIEDIAMSKRDYNEQHSRWCRTRAGENSSAWSKRDLAGGETYIYIYTIYTPNLGLRVSVLDGKRGAVREQWGSTRERGAWIGCLVRGCSCLCYWRRLLMVPPNLACCCLDLSNFVSQIFHWTSHLEYLEGFVQSSREVCDTCGWAYPDCGSKPEKCLKEIEWRAHKI